MPLSLPGRILKRMAEELALPITLLARTILSERRWPACWREHLVHAILKKSSKLGVLGLRQSVAVA